MRNKRKGIDITARTFRVLLEDMIKMWWTRELDAIEIMVWLSLQLMAVKKRPMTFNEIHRTCRISREKLSSSIKKLIKIGLLMCTEQGLIVVYEPSLPGELSGCL